VHRKLAVSKVIAIASDEERLAFQEHVADDVEVD